MSVVDKLINAMRFNDDEDYDEDEEFEDEDYYGEEKPVIREETRNTRNVPPAPAVSDEEPEEEEAPAPKPRKRFGGLSSDKSDRNESSTSRQLRKQYSEAGMEVCIIKPTSVNDAREVTDTLLANSTVVLNLEGLDVEIAQRIIDFTSGSCYAVHGNVMKISHYIFVITPQNVDVSGDISTHAGIDRNESSSLSMPYGGRN